MAYGAAYGTPRKEYMPERLFTYLGTTHHAVSQHKD